MKTKDVIKKFYQDPTGSGDMTSSLAKVRKKTLYRKIRSGSAPWSLAAFVWNDELLVTFQDDGTSGAHGLPVFTPYRQWHPTTLPPRNKGLNPMVCIGPFMERMKENMAGLCDGSAKGQILLEVMLTGLASKVVDERRRSSVSLENLKSEVRRVAAALEKEELTLTGHIKYDWNRDVELLKSEIWRSPRYISSNNIKVGFPHCDSQPPTWSSKEDVGRTLRGIPKESFYLTSDKDWKTIDSFLKHFGINLPPVFGCDWRAPDLNYLAAMKDVAYNTALNPETLSEDAEPKENASEGRLF